ncbi:hypothetical protein [Actinomadura xylanilytica]|uniref:hypothetical protein n=1 Tax=Actinomadura xylanilytica TaxID=887459 RepID=UPI00255AC5CE|nr:hypothetical protein [Actinomadura xylanilytica]MDL4770730.1 hypothetical protein [Actinomadura xylanilytica]
MATFGDMASIAADHLNEVRRALQAPDAPAQARQADTSAELARLTGVLARYTDRISIGFGVPYTEGTGVRDAARRTSILVRQAQRALGTPAESEPPTAPLAEHLRAGSIALGCGLDLLTTATATPDAAVMAATDTARSLLHMLSDHTATAAYVARHMDAPHSTAAAPLVQAALLSHTFGRRNDHAPVSAISLQRVPERTPPAVGEDLIHGIRTTLQRLSDPGVTASSSVSTWRYLSRSAAITCDISVRIIKQLALRMRDLNEHDHADALDRAAITTRRTGAKWRTISRRWTAFTGQYGTPATGPVLDTSDLVVRLGRLVYQAPDWTPGPRASYRLTPPELLAPTITDITHISAAALKAIDTYATIADHHRTAVNDIAVLDVLRRSPPNQSSLRSSARVRELLTLYNALTVQSRHTITTLGEVAQTISAKNGTVEQEIALLLHRNTTPAQQHPGSLAATDFPAPMAESLATTPAIDALSPTTARSNRMPKSGKPAGI